MYISKISIYPNVCCKGNKISTRNLNVEKENLAKKAQAELKNIKEQGKKAGTDAAWWRSEFNEAVDSLKKIANSKIEKCVCRIFQ